MLPRQNSDGRLCLDCERDVHVHEGPQVVRTYRFTTQEVAQALVEVASGETYKRASRHIRERTGRHGRTDHSQLIGDWTAAFALPLWDTFGPDRWPEIVVCDETRFTRRTIVGTSHTRWPRTEEEQKLLPRVDAFTVLVVAGQDGPVGPSRPWFAWVVAARASQKDWQECFAQLPSRPRLVVSDLNPSVFHAAEATWPLDTVTGEMPPRRVYCLYHTKAGFRLPRWTGPAEDPAHPRHADRRELLDALNACGYDEAAWHHFAATARRLGNRAEVDKWLARMGRETVIADQLRLRRGREPIANGAVEDLAAWLRTKLSGRPFTNKERTNRLLRLLVLHRRGSAVASLWSQTIRQDAISRGGTALEHVRDLTDPSGSPTLT